MNENISKNLTLVLIRGNGSPRTFTLKISQLRRNLVFLSFGFIVLLGLTIVFVGYILQQKTALHVSSTETTSATATAEPQELSDLRKEKIELQALLEERKKLPLTSESKTNVGILPIQLLGPQATQKPPGNPLVDIKNPIVKRDQTDHSIHLLFELHNIQNGQQVRGYIVVLAKTKNFMYTYPTNTLSPNENILINYAKGETFAIARFRQAEATFPALDAAQGEIHFQIFLFSNAGQILNSLHVEEARGT